MDKSSVPGVTDDELRALAEQFILEGDDYTSFREFVEEWRCRHPKPQTS